MLPEWTRDFVGIPFAEHGRDLDGCDCWGLVRLVQSAIYGRRLPCLAQGYESTTDAAAIAGLYDCEREHWHEVRGGGEAGDVVVLRIAGSPSHVGVVVAPFVMLHVLKGICTSVERFDGPLWRHRVVAVYRRK
jgi:cell wall-associated NlpC family hydrolase